MKNSSDRAKEIIERLSGRQGPPLTFMEVCGTHTVSAARSGLYGLLPPGIRLISGPGCPVCVTPVGYLDHALALCELPEVIVATFGDLMRVPGSAAFGRGDQPSSLAAARARGAEVAVVYSPRDALQLALDRSDRQVVFLGVGFETTAPAVASVIVSAAEQGLTNFSVLAANKTIVPALRALGSAEDMAVDGFMCPGHVSVIIGADAYRPLSEQLGLRCAIAGFEPVEMLLAIEALCDQAAQNRSRVDNCYPAAVKPGGNPRAREIMYRVFEPCDSQWRGLGAIAQSGLGLREPYADFDAGRRFPVSLPEPREHPGCRCGEVLSGKLQPAGCGLFGRECTPETPRGACMVSSEGSCAAHYRYRGEEDA
jgi:hydrogenase expression/formation protein HypD